MSAARDELLALAVSVECDTFSHAEVAIMRKAAEEIPCWRPIKDAPADIDLLVMTTDGRQQVAAQCGPSSLWLDRNSHNVRPTHWMPLPPPPEAGAEG